MGMTTPTTKTILCKSLMVALILATMMTITSTQQSAKIPTLVSVELVGVTNMTVILENIRLETGRSPGVVSMVPLNQRYNASTRGKATQVAKKIILVTKAALQ